jgi:hypothetical protein
MIEHHSVALLLVHVFYFFNNVCMVEPRVVERKAQATCFERRSSGALNDHCGREEREERHVRAGLATSASGDCFTTSAVAPHDGPRHANRQSLWQQSERVRRNRFPKGNVSAHVCSNQAFICSREGRRTIVRAVAPGWHVGE